MEARHLDGLTDMQRLFAAEYLVDLNATQAAVRAGASPRSAHEIGSRWLRKVEVRSAIDAAMRERIARTGITADMVVQLLARIAFADATELVGLHRTCCRHCWGGPDFLYMETPAEHRSRQRRHQRAMVVAEAKGDIPPDWDEAILVGFNGAADPNPDCPECWGHGTPQVFVSDTRCLSPEARALYAGARTTPYGIDIRMHDKVRAMDMLARHLGLYNQDDQPVSAAPQRRAELDAFYEAAMVEQKKRDEAAKERGRALAAGRMDDLTQH